jgi:hypothetical protein
LAETSTQTTGLTAFPKLTLFNPRSEGVFTSLIRVISKFPKSKDFRELVPAACAKAQYSTAAMLTKTLLMFKLLLARFIPTPHHMPPQFGMTPVDLSPTVAGVQYAAAITSRPL